MADTWPAQVEITVLWGDMDAFGHVNNTVYLRWCESARIAYFERAGLMQQMRERGVGPILARVEVDYRKPVVFPATIRASARVVRLGTTSFEMQYELVKADSGEVVAQSRSVLVLVDYRAGGKVPMDASLRERIVALQPELA